MHNENLQTSSVNPPRKPVLSLILCSRNDQYMGNSLWRLQTALNYAAQNVHELGREEDVEVIVADWGSETPLHSVLQLSPAAASIVSFVVTSPRIAREAQKDSPFSEVHALNSAARRVNGQFIGRIDQDILVGKRFLKTFFELYEGTRLMDLPLDSALLFANRRSISYRFAVHCPSFWVVDRYIRWFGRYLPVETPDWTVSRPVATPGKPFFDAPVGIWLLPRHVWNECGGYNERLIYMNEMEIEMIYRLTKKYKLVHLADLMDCDFCHLEHYHPHVPDHTSRRMNPEEYDNVFHPNSEDWGLIQYPLEVVPYSANRGDVEAGTLKQPRADWLAFTLLLLVSGAQIAWDNLIFSLTATRFLFSARGCLLAFYFKWRNRARVARETVSGQPLNRWSGLLMTRWSERQSYQRRQK